MGYRDEFLRRLRESGRWDNLTAKQQGELRQVTNGQAQRAMVFEDRYERGEREAVEEAYRLALAMIATLFDGALFDEEGLTKAGCALGLFFAELRRADVSPQTVDEDLRELDSVLVQGALVALSGQEI